MNTHDNLYNKLFTQKVFEALMSKKGHAVYQALAEAEFPQPHLLSNGEIIHKLYSQMSKCYRNEYFYQNTLLNTLLLGKHSVRTTTALSQVIVGKAVADFILINGKAVVYEIKSDLDSFDRLESQIEAYYHAFDHVCVVAPESSFSRLNTMFSQTARSASMS